MPNRYKVICGMFGGYTYGTILTHEEVLALCTTPENIESRIALGGILPLADDEPVVAEPLVPPTEPVGSATPPKGTPPTAPTEPTAPVETPTEPTESPKVMPTGVDKDAVVKDAVAPKDDKK